MTNKSFLCRMTARMALWSAKGRAARSMTLEGLSLEGPIPVWAENSRIGLGRPLPTLELPICDHKLNYFPSHPIFPLLQQIFHKCELASNSPRDRTSGDITSAESFNDDIAQFAKQVKN